MGQKTMSIGLDTEQKKDVDAHSVVLGDLGFRVPIMDPFSLNVSCVFYETMLEEINLILIGEPFSGEEVSKDGFFKMESLGHDVGLRFFER